MPSDQPSSRRARRGRRPRPEVSDRLYRIALRRLRKAGFEATPVSAITREADVAKGTFFNYFPTKEHLLARAFDEMMDAALDDLDEGGGSDAIAEGLDRLALELAGDARLAEAIVPRLGLLPPTRDPAAASEVPAGSDRAEAGNGVRAGGGPRASDEVRAEADDGGRAEAGRRARNRSRGERRDGSPVSPLAGMERLRRWIRDRLGESLRVAVPLEDADDQTLSVLLLSAFEATLREWVGATGGEPPFPRRLLHGRLAYLLVSAGFPRPSLRD